MRKMTLVALAMIASACGPDLEQSCQNYVDALQACTSDALGGTTSTGTTGTTGGTTTGADAACSVYDGLKGSEAKDAATYLDCLADTYGAADCSTAEGFAAAGTAAVSDCSLGG